MRKTLILISSFIFLIACSKVVNDTNTSSNTGGTGSNSTIVPNIKFFNVMDYGAVSVKLNNVTIGSTSLYNPTTYRVGVIGSNNISITFNNNQVLNQTVDLLAEKYYSCFFYRVGFDWKMSLVSDDITNIATGKIKVRVLDFRTQGYFDYVKVRLISPGGDQFDYANRNFLDHHTYDSYARFTTLNAGKYNVTVFNDTANLASKRDYTMASGSAYSVIMTTPADNTRSQALFNITPDIQKH